MSATSTDDPARLMSFERARDLYNERITIPTFFHKLASAYGIEPRTEMHRQQMVRIGAKLLAAEDVGMDKQASDESDILARIEKSIDVRLGQQSSSLSSLEKSAAADLSNDPQLQEAAYVINEALKQAGQ